MPEPSPKKAKTDVPEQVDHSVMLQLKRWNTPTIFNGWEQITKRDFSKPECWNLDEVKDFQSQMGPMVGRAITVVIEPSNAEHKKTNPDAWKQYREYVGSIPGPKIVMVQDLDKPRCIGAFWGEVNSNCHKALGCVGSVCDGAIRDVDEITNSGFHVLAKRLCVGHAHSHPVRWNCEVEVCGVKIQPGQLIHADKHGFMCIPPEDEVGLLEASVFMDINECKTVIPASRGSTGMPPEEVISRLSAAQVVYGAAVKEQNFGSKGGEFS